MNVHKFLSLVREITAEVDVRVLVAMFRKLDVMALLRTPDTSDPKDVKKWIRAWKTAYVVLVGSKVAGLNTKDYFLKSLAFLGEACQDEALYEELWPCIQSAILDEDDRFAISAANAKDVVIRRMQSAGTSPDAVMLTIRLLMELSQAGLNPEPEPSPEGE